jgi:hypothetical protein
MPVDVGCCLIAIVQGQAEKEVKRVTKQTSNLSVEEITNLIIGLPPAQFLRLVEAIEERAETLAMMKLAETGFKEWENPQEDIYGDHA